MIDKVDESYIFNLLIDMSEQNNPIIISKF